VAAKPRDRPRLACGGEQGRLGAVSDLLPWFCGSVAGAQASAFPAVHSSGARRRTAVTRLVRCPEVVENPELLVVIGE
jgi:hypothetical protein